MKSIFLLFVFLLAPIFSLFGGHHEILDLSGKKGPGKGKAIVLVSGDEEYRSEESMPMLAKILSQSTGLTARFFFLGIPPASTLTRITKLEFGVGSI